MYFFVLIVCIFAILIVSYVRNRLNLWQKRGISCIPWSLIRKCTVDLLLGKRHIGQVLEDMYRSASNQPFVGCYQILKPRLMIRDPQLIARIVVKDFSYFDARQPISPAPSRLSYSVANLFGEKWKIVRNKLITVFTPMKLKLMFSMVDACTEHLEVYLRSFAESKEPIDIKDIMARYTTDVIGNCASGMRVDTINDPSQDFRAIGKIGPTSTALFANVIRRTVGLINPALLKYIGVPEFSKEMETFFFDLLKAARKARQNEQTRRNDFVQMLLNLSEKELMAGQNMDKTEDKIQVFSDEVLASNMMIFYIGGFETTATTLTYCLYELALNQDIQDRARNEAKDTECAFGAINFDTLSHLAYIDMVVSETLRKYPVIVMMIRMCTKTYRIPDTSISLTPNDLIGIPVYSLHHDEKYFPDPQKFNPERFNVENKSKIKPYTYLPFGDGPRICLGIRFAKLEMKLCLAKLLSKYRFEPCDKTSIPIQPATRSMLLIPSQSVWLTIEKI